MNGVNLPNKENILKDISKDIDVILNYLNNLNDRNNKLKELKELENTINNLKKYGIEVPKELIDKYNKLKETVKDIELTNSQKILLKYLKDKYNITTTVKNTVIPKGIIVVKYSNGNTKQYDSFRALCKEYCIDPKKDAPKRVLLRKVKNISDIIEVYIGNTLVYKRDN